MRPLLAILLALLTLLPPPAVLAVAVPETADCPEHEQCRPACLCCQADTCSCAGKTDPRPSLPQPAVPLRGADFHPVAALPPQTETVFPGLIPADSRPSKNEVPAQRVVHSKPVPLFVRHCAYLL